MIRRLVILSLIFLVPYKADAVELREFYGFDVVGISDDGSFVLQGTGKSSLENATSKDFTENGELRSWLSLLATSEGELVPLQPAPGFSRPRAVGMSRSGEFVIGQSMNGGERHVTIWNSDGVQLRALPNDGSGWSEAVSDDGEIVGWESSPTRPWRWLSDGTPEPLTTLAEFDLGSATAVSSDGRVIAGVSRTDSVTTAWEATLWIHDETGDLSPISLGRFQGMSTLAREVSADGTVVVGDYFEDTDVVGEGSEKFRWTESGGFQQLGRLRGAEWVSISATNSDASVVVGVAQPDRKRSFVWDEEHGMRDLKTVLIEEHGVSENSFPEPHFRVDEISPDGTILGGYAGDAWPYATGWVMYLDRPLVVTSGVAGDFNGNAELDGHDIDLLAYEIISERNVDLFDVNDDFFVDIDDREFWVKDLAQTFFGDANLDQSVTFDDFLALSSGFGELGGWAQGDFSGNGTVAFEDFLMLSQNYGQTFVAAQAAVPEPTGCCLLVVGLLAIVNCRKRRAA